MNRIAKFIDSMVIISGHVSGWLVPAMIVLIVIEVFMRYVLHNPPMVADEFSAYMLVALSYLGMAYTWKQGGHVRITLFVRRLPKKIAIWIRLIGLLISFCFLVGLNHSCLNMVIYAQKINLRSDTWLTFPLFWPQLTVLIGFVFLALTIFSEMVQLASGLLPGNTIKEIQK